VDIINLYMVKNIMYVKLNSQFSLQSILTIFQTKRCEIGTTPRLTKTDYFTDGMGRTKGKQEEAGKWPLSRTHAEQHNGSPVASYSLGQGIIDYFTHYYTLVNKF